MRRRLIPSNNRSALNVTASSSTGSQYERQDGAWFAAGAFLTAGGLIPSLATCMFTQQVNKEIVIDSSLFTGKPLVCCGLAG